MIENGVGDWPDELADSELCEAYGWTWPELQETPVYVRKVFSQIQSMKRAKAAQDNDRAMTAAKNPGREVVRRA